MRVAARLRAVHHAPASGFDINSVNWAVSLDSSAVAGSDGDAIATWAGVASSGSSGSHSAAQTDQASKPILKTGILNGLSVLRYNGSGSWMQIIPGSAFLTGTTMTGFVVAVRRGVQASAAALSAVQESQSNDYDNAASAEIGLEDSGADTHAIYRNNGYGANLGTHPGNNVPFILTFRFDGTNSYIRRNGTDATPVASTGTFAVDRLLIGAKKVSGSIANLTQYDYAEIKISTDNLSSGDRASVLASLGAKWGISG